MIDFVGTHSSCFARMQPLPLRRLAAFTAVCLLLLGGAKIWRLCERDAAVAFLPARAGAAWILDDCPPDGYISWSAPKRTVFKHQFFLAAPAVAEISLCAFRAASVEVNGKDISALALDGKNWKLPVTASAGLPLPAGTNEIIVTVTNVLGPPAVWLRLQAGNFSLGTDESWLASPVSRHWLNARRADEPPTLPEWSQIKDHSNLTATLRRVGLGLPVMILAALGTVIFARNKIRQNPDQ
jgi:hypothetical protein